jgi:3'-phosphoadenosine 5'-phosphosulfate sulfotransferase (PAPS reductase)/FAD synthetase
MKVNPVIQELIDTGALFVINTSGGKDSQAMTIKLRQIIPVTQLVLIHSHLPEVEWEGTKEHIENTAMGIPVHFTQAKKTFFEMVEHRQKFPSPAMRQCTSDLKRGPIQKFINNYAKEMWFGTVVNCMGLRAEESSARAKKIEFRHRPDLSSRGRMQYEWLPIHDMKLDEVWNTISAAGQQPHWAYKEGMTRLSCCFCIMASKNDLQTAARLNPELYNRYVETEKRLGFSLSMSKKYLPEIVEA